MTGIPLFSVNLFIKPHNSVADNSQRSISSNTKIQFSNCTRSLLCINSAKFIFTGIPIALVSIVLETELNSRSQIFFVFRALLDSPKY